MSAEESLGEQFPEPGSQLHFAKPGLNVGEYGTHHPADIALRWHKIAKGLHETSKGPSTEEAMHAAREIQTSGAIAQEEEMSAAE